MRISNQFICSTCDRSKNVAEFAASLNTRRIRLFISGCMQSLLSMLSMGNEKGGTADHAAVPPGMSSRCKSGGFRFGSALLPEIPREAHGEPQDNEFQHEISFLKKC
jgi:hypothetical protein